MARRRSTLRARSMRRSSPPSRSVPAAAMRMARGRPDQAQRLVDVTTRSLGGHIAAAEFMNEPTLAATNGAPPGYDAKAYGRDFKMFREWMQRAAPGDADRRSGLDRRRVVAIRVGHHHARSAGRIRPRRRSLLLSSLQHALAALRRPRRSGARRSPRTGWRAPTRRSRSTAALRDAFEPGKPIWLTETADAACGGNRWDKTFLDTFRYLDQLGRLARAGVQVVMHNTLAASDYGLLDERTFRPRPSYWAALLWHRLMGTTVLDASAAAAPDLHRLRALPSGHARRRVRARDQHRRGSASLTLSRCRIPSERYTLTCDAAARARQCS